MEPDTTTIELPVIDAPPPRSYLELAGEHRLTPVIPQLRPWYRRSR